MFAGTPATKVFSGTFLLTTAPQATTLDRNFNKDKLSYSLRVIDERVSKYLREMEALDKQEEKAEATRELEEKLKNIMKCKEKYNELLLNLKEPNLNEVS